MMWYNPRMTNTLTTRYLKSIKSVWDTLHVLKPGSNNKKLGWKVSRGRHKGKRIFSLTLTERETCPTSCHHWADCYGNNMPFAHRYNVNGLEDKLRDDIAKLMAKHKDGILIRLHVLGDFYSAEYVEFWQEMLLEYPKLAIFGYTARQDQTKIGKAIWLLNNRFAERCVIRHSGNFEADTITGWLYAAEESFEGSSFDCPEQVGKVKSCADCGLCWTAKKTVRFLSH